LNCLYPDRASCSSCPSWLNSSIVTSAARGSRPSCCCTASSARPQLADGGSRPGVTLSRLRPRSAQPRPFAPRAGDDFRRNARRRDGLARRPGPGPRLDPRHSLGGKLAMRLACRHPARVARLIVVDIAPKAYPGMAQRTEIVAMNELRLEGLRSRAEAEVRMEGGSPIGRRGNSSPPIWSGATTAPGAGSSMSRR